MVSHDEFMWKQSVSDDGKQFQISVDCGFESIDTIFSFIFFFFFNFMFYYLFNRCELWMRSKSKGYGYSVWHSQWCSVFNALSVKQCNAALIGNRRPWRISKLQHIALHWITFVFMHTFTGLTEIQYVEWLHWEHAT